MPVKYYKRQVNKNPKKDGPKARWSEKQKFEAVAMYKMVGSLRAVGNTLGIPEETMRNWHQSDWWKQMEDEIATESRTVRSKRLDKLVDLATEIVEDRLTNGDYTYDAKSGTLRRKPVNALTAGKILSTAVDKQVLLEKLAQDSRKAETQERIESRLAFLMDEMHRFAKSKDVTRESVRLEGGDPESQDDSPALLGVEDDDAVYEEREEGLQEGIEVGAYESDPPTGRPSSPEQGQGPNDGAGKGQEG